MGQLCCTHAREEVRRGQPEGTKRHDNRGAERNMYIKEKSYVRLYCITLFNYWIKTLGYVLNKIVKQQDAWLWTGCIWLGTRTTGEIL